MGCGQGKPKVQSAEIIDKTDKLIGQMIVYDQDKESPYIIKRYVAGGAYGQIYVGEHKETKSQVAIKLERIDVKIPQLHMEYRYYTQVIGSSAFTPEVFTFGFTGNYLALVMQLLGPSLEELYNTCKAPSKGLTQVCVAALGIQLIRAFEVVHDKGLLHRDIKPANFMMGQSKSECSHKMYIIDLGLGKLWMKDGKHIPYNKRKKVVLGTPEYMPLRMHSCQELSRRDDLESVLYVLALLYHGKLPWSGPDNEPWAQGEQRMGQIKEKTSSSVLFNDMHENFKNIFRHIRKLDFTDRPNYVRYIGHFHEVIQELTESDIPIEAVEQVYDWDSSHQKKDQNKTNMKYRTKKKNSNRKAKNNSKKNGKNTDQSRGGSKKQIKNSSSKK